MDFDRSACEFLFPNREISCSEIGSPEVCQSQPFEVIKELGKDLSKPENKAKKVNSNTNSHT
jgi:hypothetical protein